MTRVRSHAERELPADFESEIVAAEVVVLEDTRPWAEAFGSAPSRHPAVEPS